MSAISPSKLETSIHKSQPSKSMNQQDFFIAQLKNEIYDLRQRQRDYGQLQEQHQFLKQKCTDLQHDNVSFISLKIRTVKLCVLTTKSMTTTEVSKDSSEN